MLKFIFSVIVTSNSLNFLVQENLVHSKNCNLKFLSILNFSFNLHPKEEKFIEIYLVIPC
jgi:hypothetical protein